MWYIMTLRQQSGYLGLEKKGLDLASLREIKTREREEIKWMNRNKEIAGISLEEL